MLLRASKRRVGIPLRSPIGSQYSGGLRRRTNCGNAAPASPPRSCAAWLTAPQKGPFAALVGVADCATHTRKGTAQPAAKRLALYRNWPPTRGVQLLRGPAAVWSARGPQPAAYAARRLASLAAVGSPPRPLLCLGSWFPAAGPHAVGGPGVPAFGAVLVVAFFPAPVPSGPPTGAAASAAQCAAGAAHIFFDRRDDSCYAIPISKQRSASHDGKTAKPTAIHTGRN